MARSLKKGPYVDKNILKKIDGADSKKIIKTWARNCTIIPEMIGYTFAVYNGRKHIPIYISENMVGHKLGEFSFTRTFKGHPNK